MRSAMSGRDDGPWVARALALVLAITAARAIGLRFAGIDLFVDESQYWLWSQSPDFGYYSKPPLIAWVIGASTWLAGSDDAFWIRLPAPLLHALTAMILGAAAARLRGSRAAFWTAATYVTLPFVSVGSTLMSTDTVMAPFFAAALLCWITYFEGRVATLLFLSGLLAGAAFLGKYVALFLPFGVLLSAILMRDRRMPLSHFALFCVGVALTAAPNVVWNLTHDLTTFGHTMDNFGWVREASPLATLSFASLVETAISQFAVLGPILFAVLLWQVVAPADGAARMLRPFILPALLVVAAQAVLHGAYANWTVSAYFAGTLVAVAALLRYAPVLLPVSLVLHGLVAVTLPLLISLSPQLSLSGDRPLLARYLGRAEFSGTLIAAARELGATAIVTSSRDVLADLFHTGRGEDMAFRALAPAGRPMSYFEQVFPLEPTASGKVVAVLDKVPDCPDGLVRPVPLDSRPFATSYRDLGAWLVPAECLHRDD
jgi:4-amino-4-deoxy-L-arabinose transferase-like glycosyltransferase